MRVERRRGKDVRENGKGKEMNGTVRGREVEIEVEFMRRG